LLIDAVANLRLVSGLLNEERAEQSGRIIPKEFVLKHARAEQVIQTLPPTDISTTGEVTLNYKSNFTQPQFEDAVRQCVEYIRAGDIFQVVISQRLAVPLTADPFELYRTLRVVNPSPFMFFLRTPKCTLVGSSPEIMVRVVDGKVTVRPLAGTRRRGRNEEEDRQLAEELLADPKDRPGPQRRRPRCPLRQRRDFRRDGD